MTLDADPFEALDAIESRSQSLATAQFFEALRGLASFPLDQWPSPAVLAELGPPQLVELLESVRDSLRTHPERRDDAVLEIDVWTARMRGRWQVVDGDD